MEKITDEELSRLQAIHKEYRNSKMHIADFEIQKIMEIKKLEVLESQLRELEISMVKNYGEGAMVNSGTGEITRKDEDK